MLVRDYMLPHPAMIDPGKRVTEVQRLMVEQHIDFLPVVGDGKRLLGMCTRDRLAIPPDQLASLDVWEIARYISSLTARRIMIPLAELVTINPDATLEQAAELMIKHHVGALPVIDERIVVGLITQEDLLNELRELLGAVEPGWRITVQVPRHEDEFVTIIRMIADHGWSLMAMGNVKAPKSKAHIHIVLKLRGCTDTELRQAFQECTAYQILDLRETSYHKLVAS